MKGIKIYFIVVIILFVIFFIVDILSKEDISNWNMVEYEVREGDTLYKISKDYCPENLDIRKYVDYIKKKNNLENGIIKKGDLIKLYRK